MACDKARFNKFFHCDARRRRVSRSVAYEAGFVSAAHSTDDIATTVALGEKGFRGEGEPHA
jgi:glutamate-1-semialdehyde 2,1-aminomutase